MEGFTIVMGRYADVDLLVQMVRVVVRARMVVLKRRVRVVRREGVVVKVLVGMVGEVRKERGVSGLNGVRICRRQL